MIDLNMLKKIEDEESVQDIDDLSKNYVTFQDSVLKIDPKIREEGKMLLDNFILFQETEPSMHKQLKQLLVKNDIHANNILRKIEYKIYKKRFGEEPLLRDQQ